MAYSHTFQKNSSTSSNRELLRQTEPPLPPTSSTCSSAMEEHRQSDTSRLNLVPLANTGAIPKSNRQPCNNQNDLSGLRLNSTDLPETSRPNVRQETSDAHICGNSARSCADEINDFFGSLSLSARLDLNEILKRLIRAVETTLASNRPLALDEKAVIPEIVKLYKSQSNPLSNRQQFSMPRLLTYQAFPGVCTLSYFEKTFLCNNLLYTCQECRQAYCVNCLESNFHRILCSEQSSASRSGLQTRLSELKYRLNGSNQSQKVQSPVHTATVGTTSVHSDAKLKKRRYMETIHKTTEGRGQRLQRLKRQIDICTRKLERLTNDSDIAKSRLSRRSRRIAREIKMLTRRMQNISQDCSTKTPHVKLLEEFYQIVNSSKSFNQTERKPTENFSRESVKQTTRASYNEARSFFNDFRLPSGSSIRPQVQVQPRPQVQPQRPPLVQSQRQPQVPRQPPLQPQRQPPIQPQRQPQVQSQQAPTSNQQVVPFNNPKTTSSWRWKNSYYGKNLARSTEILTNNRFLELLPSKPIIYKSQPYVPDHSNRIRPIPGLSKRLRVVDNRGHYPLVMKQRTFSPGDLNRPWGICVNYRHEILITDREQNCVKIYNSNFRYLKKFGEPGRNVAQFNRPTGITITSRGEIVVADKDNHRIQIFNRFYQFISMFGRFGYGLGELKFPWDVACNASDAIAVSDSKNHRVQIFDRSGVLIHWIDNTKGTKFKYPRGVCFTPWGDLLVTDFDLHRIVNCRSNGTFGYYGRFDGPFCRPQGITCDEFGNIIVVDSNNHRINVFDSRFQLQFTLENGLGSIVGQMNKPADVALTPEGRIAVVDFGNNRVQIF